MKHSRVCEQRKIIVSGIINDHVTLKPLPRRVSKCLPLSSRKRSLFYKTTRACNFSVTFCMIFNSRHFLCKRAETWGLGWFKRENSFGWQQNDYVSLRFVMYRENKSKIRNVARIVLHLMFASPLSWSREFGCYVDWDKLIWLYVGIMSIRRRWLWTIMLVIIARRITSSSIVIVEDECLRKLYRKKMLPL